MRRLLFIMFFLLGCGVGHRVAAQNPEQGFNYDRLEGKPLTKAIKVLQRDEASAFSFSSGSIDDIVVPALPDSMRSVVGLLSLTLDNTPFAFERIGGTYVIFPRSAADDKSRIYRFDFTLSGIVRDAVTGEALPFATVGIEGTEINATTNTDGKFTLMRVPSDTAVVSARYLGYQPLNVNLTPESAHGLLPLDLHKQERELPSVEVTAERAQLLDLGNRVGQVAFNPAEISKLPNLGENDLFAALRLLPGVGGNAEASSGLRIRGSASDENLVLFDGITVYHVDHFFGFLSAFNSNVVKNVQVSKGGFGAKYGGRSTGLINITGIDGNKKEPALTVEAGALSASVLAELPIVEDKASLVFAYRRSYTDVLRTRTYRNMFNNLFNASIPNVMPSNINVFDGDQAPDFSYYDLNAKFHFKPTEKDAIAVSYYQGRDDLSIAFGAEADGITRISEDASTWGNRGGSFKWSRKWNQRFFTYVNYGISRYHSDLNAEVSFFFNNDQLLSRRFFDQRVNLDDNTLRVDNAFEIDANSRLEFGFWHSTYRVVLQAQDQDFIFQDSVQQAALPAWYIDYERRWGRLTAKGGLRVSTYDGAGTTYLEPRLSMSYQLLPTIGLKAAAGRYYQMIRRLNERSLYFSIPETWALAGATDVPVLKSDQFILGVLWGRRGWEVDVEVYRKAESGIVEFLLPEFGIASGSLSQFAVGGQRDVWGMDVLVKRNIGRQQLLAGYTLLDAQSAYVDVNGGRPFRSLGVSRHEGSLVYKILRKRWDFSGSFVLSSGLPYTAVLGTFIVTLESGEQQQFVSLGGVNASLTSWNHRMDIGAAYTFPLKKGALKCGFSVYNLYNNLNVKFIDYFEIPEEGSQFYTLGRREVFGLGFTPSIFLRLKI